MQEANCPVCDHAGVVSHTGFDRKGTHQVQCPNCGEFFLSMEANDDVPHLPQTTRRKLERFLYETRDEADRLLTSGDLPSDRWPGRMLSFRTAKELYEDDGSSLDKYENTIRRVGSQVQTFGHVFSLPKDRWLVPTMDDDEALSILHALMDEGYLSGQKTLTREDSFSLTPLGLRHAAELASQARTDTDSVFIAACFSQELADARDTLAGVVAELGYRARIVSREPHNELIDLKIYELIRESRFAVADLTCNRQSVYYEVGFAHGLGLEVVLTCKADSLDNATDDFKRVHFDLNHRNILVWSNTTELAERLSAHIYQAFGARA